LDYICLCKNNYFFLKNNLDQRVTLRVHKLEEIVSQLEQCLEQKPTHLEEVLEPRNFLPIKLDQVGLFFFTKKNIHIVFLIQKKLYYWQNENGLFAPIQQLKVCTYFLNKI
jgi:hypothetical protein